MGIRVIEITNLVWKYSQDQEARTITENVRPRSRTLYRDFLQKYGLSRCLL